MTGWQIEAVHGPFLSHAFVLKETHKNRDSQPHSFYSTQCKLCPSTVHVWATQTRQFKLECLQFWHLLLTHNNSAIILCALNSTVDTLQSLIVWCLWFYEGHFQSRLRKPAACLGPCQLVVVEPNCLCLSDFTVSFSKQTSVCECISHFSVLDWL